MPDIITFALLPGLGLTMVVFGFAPPFLLRLILRMYPRDDLRRAELMAELRALPWRNRPIWIAEQFESGLSEGLPHRARERRRRREDREAQRQAEWIRSVHNAVEGDIVTVKRLSDPNSDNINGWIEVQEIQVKSHTRRRTISLDGADSIVVSEHRRRRRRRR